MTTRRPNRPFTDTDYRYMRELLLHGGSWEDQYTVPAPPWSVETERYCEQVRLEVDLVEWQEQRAEARRRRAV